MLSRIGRMSSVSNRDSMSTLSAKMGRVSKKRSALVSTSAAEFGRWISAAHLGTTLTVSQRQSAELYSRLLRRSSRCVLPEWVFHLTLQPAELKASMGRHGRMPPLLERVLRFAPASESMLQAEDAQLGARKNAPQRQTSQKRIRIHGQSGAGKAGDRSGPAGSAATFLLHARRTCPERA